MNWVAIDNCHGFKRLKDIVFLVCAIGAWCKGNGAINHQPASTALRLPQEAMDLCLRGQLPQQLARRESVRQSGNHKKGAAGTESRPLPACCAVSFTVIFMC